MAELTIAEKILKRKKDPAFQQELESEQLNFEGRAEQELESALKDSKLQQAAKHKRKNYFKLGGLALGGLFVIWVYNFLFALPIAGLGFGICKVYLEQNVRYPHTLQLSTVEQLNDFVRIWYTQVNAFGEYRMDHIKCTFESDPERGTQISDITFKSGFFERSVDAAKIEAFNKMIPVIAANPGDLTYPRPLPDNLKDLKAGMHLLRRPIL